MKQHDKIEQQLVLLVAGSLSADEERVLQAHVESCPACARKLLVWRRLVTSFPRLPETLPTPALLTRIATLARARRQEVVRQRWFRNGLLGLSMVAFLISATTLEGILLVNQWLEQWLGWQVPGDLWTAIAVWMGLGWLTALSLLPLLREQKKRLQEKTR